MTRAQKQARVRGAGRVLIAWLWATSAACDPPHWRYLVTLAPPPALSQLPDGNVLALDDAGAFPTAAVRKSGSDSAVDVFWFRAGTWPFDQRLVPRSGAIGHFAASVALSGDTLARPDR